MQRVDQMRHRSSLVLVLPPGINSSWLHSYEPAKGWASW